ncbi:4a-hydroxytetrahydrobiopterin dehydratase [Leptospira fletcheri]|uniref:4a-hydroxytetrahydrobiopterin dehydratase n=1 Tax=Leptospira fletcheri TaxID=2484981 RepID=A0A4R9GAS8_9LEPT|nr:4a-hydroxytetrahydrobiopterin dehydratase [Leptospira fletcheri]TGK08838.1 4a-hydroxytetrahydrobiopterin dehydratase [Leptospira fletcheri]
MSNAKKMDPDEVRRKLPKGWEIFIVDEIPRLRKKYSFSQYSAGIRFVNELAKEAERLDHHPDLGVFYGSVNVEIFTHSLQGLSDLDLEFVAFAERAYENVRL